MTKPTPPEKSEPNLSAEALAVARRIDALPEGVHMIAVTKMRFRRGQILRWEVFVPFGEKVETA